MFIAIDVLLAVASAMIGGALVALALILRVILHDFRVWLREQQRQQEIDELEEVWLRR